jgi:hypothetical protein
VQEDDGLCSFLVAGHLDDRLGTMTWGVVCGGCRCGQKLQSRSAPGRQSCNYRGPCQLCNRPDCAKHRQIVNYISRNAIHQHKQPPVWSRLSSTPDKLTTTPLSQRPSHAQCPFPDAARPRSDPGTDRGPNPLPAVDPDRTTGIPNSARPRKYIQVVFRSHRSVPI